MENLTVKDIREILASFSDDAVVYFTDGNQELYPVQKNDIKSYTAGECDEDEEYIVDDETLKGTCVLINVEL